MTRTPQPLASLVAQLLLGCRLPDMTYMEFRMINKNYLLIASLLLSACGGGGGTDSSPSNAQVSVLANAGGTVSPMTASVPAGTSASFSVVAAEGYSLKTIQGCNGSLQGANYVTGVLSSNCTVNVEFARNSYQITAAANEGGSISVGEGSVLHGDTWSLVLQPNQGYQVESVSGCGTGTLDDNNYVTAPITSNCQLSVQFSKKRVSVSGLVAIGAPLANATVEAKCQGDSGFSEIVTTNAQGEFTGQLIELDLPCALHAHADNPAISLQGIVVQSGRVNITPFTDMTLALASGLQSPLWYEQGSVTDTLPLLADAQAVLLALFQSNGYTLPQGEFKPFDGELVIGDEWDVVLDQLATGIRQTASLDYAGLVQDMLEGQTHKFPLPQGDEEETAEACFNPELYREGTQVDTKRHLFSGVDGLENHNLFEYRLVNLPLPGESSKYLLAQQYEVIGCFTGASDLSHQICMSNFGHQTTSVDLALKTVANVSAAYDQDPMYNSPDQVLLNVSFKETYGPQGNEIRYRFPAGIEFNETFDRQTSFSFSTIYHEGSLVVQQSESMITRTRKFVGLTSLTRGGKAYEVCEFAVEEFKSVKTGSTDPENPSGDSSRSYSQYFLVGDGVEVTDPDITSIMIDGVEVYANPFQR